MQSDNVPYDVQFSSPLDAFLLQEPGSGPALFAERMPTVLSLLRKHLATIEATLYPTEEYPQRRCTAKARRVLVLLDDTDVRPTVQRRVMLNRTDRASQSP
jgi:hypothetical protein